MKGKAPALVGLVIGLVASVGCGTTRSVTADSTMIAAKIKANLAKEVRFSNLTAVKVDSVKGRVTLSGQVATKADRAAAGELASSVQGVAIVYNELEVRPAHP
jgi:osmotically-inducible protein OsmY